MPRLVGFALIVAWPAGARRPAAASKRIYSYDSANPLTEQMTEAGLTFVFDRSFMSDKGAANPGDPRHRLGPT